MSLWRRWRSNAVAVAVGGDRGLGGQSAADREIPPAVEHGHLVGARVAHPELGHLRAFPVALPVEVALEAGELLEAVAIVAGAVDGVRAGAVAQRDRRDRVQGRLQGVAAKARGVPGDDDRSGLVADVGHHPRTWS